MFPPTTQRLAKTSFLIITRYSIPPGLFWFCFAFRVIVGFIALFALDAVDDVCSGFSVSGLLLVVFLHVLTIC